MSFLEQEINEQPNVVARLLNEEWPQAKRVAEIIREYKPTFVLIAARGTSDNAARYAQYLFGTHARLAVGLAAPSLHTLYETAPDLSHALVIGISQSGQAADVTRVIEDARAQGALTVSITNFPESPLARAADHHLWLRAGEEQSVAATKTYTAQLTIVAMLAAGLSGDEQLLADLRELPEQMRETLALSESIKDWIEEYKLLTQMVSIGRGYNYCTAMEVNLKVLELCYVTGVGYSEADFLHGPIAMLQPNYPVIIIAPKGRPLATLGEFIDKVEGKQAERLIVSNDAETLAQATHAMPIADTPEWLTPITAVLPGQVFALRLAEVRGNPLDKPRGLSKVTVTL